MHRHHDDHADRDSNQSDHIEVCTLPPIQDARELDEMKTSLGDALRLLESSELSITEMAKEFLQYHRPFCDIEWVRAAASAPVTAPINMDQMEDEADQLKRIELISVIRDVLIPDIEVVEASIDDTPHSTSETKQVASPNPAGFVHQIPDDTDYYAIWLVVGERTGSDSGTSMMCLRQALARQYNMKLIFTSDVRRLDPPHLSLNWMNRDFWVELELMCGKLPICIIDVKGGNGSWLRNTGKTPGVEDYVEEKDYDRDEHANQVLTGRIDRTLPFMYTIAKTELGHPETEFLLKATHGSSRALHAAYDRAKMKIDGYQTINDYIPTKDYYGIDIRPIFLNEILWGILGGDHYAPNKSGDRYMTRRGLDPIVRAISIAASTRTYTYTRPPESKLNNGLRTVHYTVPLINWEEYDPYTYETVETSSDDEIAPSNEQIQTPFEADVASIRRKFNISQALPVHKESMLLWDTPIDINVNGFPISGRLVRYGGGSAAEDFLALTHVILSRVPVAIHQSIFKTCGTRLARRIATDEVIDIAKTGVNTIMVPDFSRWPTDSAFLINPASTVDDIYNLWFHGFVFNGSVHSDTEELTIKPYATKYPLVGLFDPINIRSELDADPRWIAVNALMPVNQHLHARDPMHRYWLMGTDVNRFQVTDPKKIATGWGVCVDTITQRTHIMYFMITPEQVETKLPKEHTEKSFNWIHAMIQLAEGTKQADVIQQLRDILSVYESKRAK